jgi:hypothetical protein
MDQRPRVYQTRAGRIFLGILYFGLGVAFAVGTVDGLLHPAPHDVYAPWFLGMFAAMFLLGSYLLLRSGRRHE